MSAIVNAVGKKYASQYASQAVVKVFGDEDPYYDTVEITKKNGTVKNKRIWKQPPEQGLSPNDTKILKQFNKRAWYLDMLFSLCGLRLGWSAVIGIIPVIGDCINIYMALQLVRLAQKIDGGLPVTEQSKMMTNVFIDFAMGIIPVVGIVAGALYRANSRNALILQHYLRKKAENNVQQGLFLLDPAAQSGKGWFHFGKKNKAPVATQDSVQPPTQQPKPQQSLIDLEEPSAAIRENEAVLAGSRV